MECELREGERLRESKVHRGFSILETIIAFGILISAFTVFFRLYISALNYSGQADRKLTAANVAQRQLVKLRAWSALPVSGGRGFDDWSSFTDTTFPDEEYPNYQVRIQSASLPVVSPASELATGVNIKTLNGSYRKVQITVSWPEGSVQCVSLVADPTRQLRTTDPVVVNGPGGTIARDATRNFTVSVFDNDNQAIPDPMVTWYVQPIDGTGSISQDIEGMTATFTNVSEQMNGTPQYTGGSCRVVARVSYRGQEVWGQSGILVLAP